jgi:hypothetical protein
VTGYAYKLKKVFDDVSELDNFKHRIIDKCEVSFVEKIIDWLNKIEKV